MKYFAIVLLGMVWLPARDPFTGTKWTASVAKGCTDSLVFRSGHRARSYSCEVDEWYDGIYVISNDTIIVSWVSESEDGGGKERWRTRYFFSGNLLRPISSQGYSHGKWEKPELLNTSADYVFKKEVSGPAR
ncbi:MAG TPA: hypothetical protein VL727_15210 [Puia sp.]|nr:hypothetical protein [Puia sp.]